MDGQTDITNPYVLCNMPKIPITFPAWFNTASTSRVSSLNLAIIALDTNPGSAACLGVGEVGEWGGGVKDTLTFPAWLNTVSTTSRESSLSLAIIALDKNSGSAACGKGRERSSC